MFFNIATIAAIAGLAAALPASDSKAMMTSNSNGIVLCNRGTTVQEICAFKNLWNGNGAAGPQFDPDMAQFCKTLQSGECQFESLGPANWAGRFQRGRLFQATYCEYQQHAASDGQAHGDISIQQACDGPATIETPTGQWAGFTKQLVANAPAGATIMREDGVKVLASIVGNWNQVTPNVAAMNYAASIIDPTTTYVLNSGTGVKDIQSANNVMTCAFY